MPETTFHIPRLTDQDAADAVMFVGTTCPA